MCVFLKKPESSTLTQEPYTLLSYIDKHLLSNAFFLEIVRNTTFAQ